MTPTRTRLFSRHMLPACAVVVAVATAVGCSNSSDKTDKTPTTPPATTSSAPSPDPTAQAKTAAVTAYTNMWIAAAAAFHAGKVTSPDLERYSRDKALANQRGAGLYYQQRGTVMNGKPDLSPQVVSIQLTETPYIATINDCIDTAHFVEIKKATGKVVPQEGPKHHVVTATVGFNGKAWIVTNYTIDRDRTC